MKSLGFLCAPLHSASKRRAGVCRELSILSRIALRFCLGFGTEKLQLWPVLAVSLWGEMPRFVQNKWKPAGGLERHATATA